MLGRVAGAHGVRGEIRVRWLGDGPDTLLGAGELGLAREPDDPAPRSYEVQQGGTGRAGEVRLKLRGVDDRDQAAELRGCFVTMDAASTPPLPEGEYYWYQLVGCRVETAAGEPVGTVRELLEAGAHDVLAVEGDDGRTRLIPTAREFLLEIDVEQARIVVRDLEGLLDPV